MLDKDADVHKATNSNRTPLHEASYSGRIDLVRLLLANGAAADIDRKDEDGNTPLADAGYGDHSDIVALLVEHKAGLQAAPAPAPAAAAEAPAPAGPGLEAGRLVCDE